MVEPFGAQEHGAAGGSYETGAIFSQEVFGWVPPLAIAKYANIHLVGETKKMSSSLGNLITPAEALEIMPPEILRYFIIRSKPDRMLYFDPGLGLYNLIDEFSSVQRAANAKEDHPFLEAYSFAMAQKPAPAADWTISSISFKHLVAVYQTARGDEEQALKILSATGYSKEIRDQAEAIKAELKFIKNGWANMLRARSNLRFKRDLPKVNLRLDQKQFLTKLADNLEEAPLEAQAIHDLIYKIKDEVGLSPAEAFEAIYQVILNKSQGPKAGWFLTSIDLNWLINRLRLQK